MISPHTPPGTEIVCIDSSAGPLGSCDLTDGAIYTVARIVPALCDRHVVLLAELPLTQIYEPPWGLVTVGFELKRFRYLDIPDSLVVLLRENKKSLEVV